MIEIIVFKNSTEIMGFEVSGHAESDEYGRDIVCASVSVLAQTAVNALGELTGVDFDYEIAEGYLKCEVPKTLPLNEKQRVATILKTIYVGYRGVAESYPDYVSICVRRCDDNDD